MKRRTKKLDRLARIIAEDEHVNNMRSRRGTGQITDMDLMYLYDNNPWEAGAHFRDEQIAEFRRRLKAEGIAEVGFGVYPEHGEDAGYTFAIILDCSRDREAWLAQTYLELVQETVRRMDQERAATV